MKEVLISIVIPCYNNATTIRESVMSCVGQTYKNFEIIIVNDGSTDNSWEVMQELSRQFPQVEVYTQENHGPARARNFGTTFANGKYLIFLDADDIFAPTFLSECISIFNEKPEVDIVYSVVEKFEGEEGIWGLMDYSAEMILLRNCFPISSMISLAKFKDIGLFDEELAHAEDWEMWIRMTARYPNTHKINTPLFFYRKRAAKDSITDLNELHNYANDTHLYIYNKHYKLYCKYKMSISDLLRSKEEAMELLRYKRKYDSIWYRKLFYRLFKKKKLN